MGMTEADKFFAFMFLLICVVLMLLHIENVRQDNKIDIMIRHIEILETAENK